jgi:uncharacterized protein YggE
MRFLWCGLLALAVDAVAMSGLSAQGTDAQSPTIVTVGVSEVRLPPDWATIAFSLETRGQSAAQASSANRERLEQLVDTLNRLAGPRDSVRVQALSIRTAENYQEREIVGYDAVAVIEVTLRNLTQLPAMLDAAFANGATTTLGDVRFRSDRADAATAEALGKAFADARRQAEALAHAAAVDLGSIVEISTQPRPRVFMEQDVRFGVAPASITPSDVLVRASVEVRWRIQGTQP